MKKKLSIILSVVLVLVLSLSVMVACNPEEPAEAKASSYVTIDINPSIELVLDQNGIVLSANALNQDASIMLYKENGIVGVSAEIASQKIVELAISMGYINDENKAVSVSVAADGGEETEHAIYANINASISAAGIANAVEVTVENAVDIVSEIELSRVKAVNEGKEGYDDTLTVAKFRLVKSAMAFDHDLSMDEAVKMDVDELAKIVEDSHKYYEDKLDNAYQKKLNFEQRTRDNLIESYIEWAYAEVYANRFLNDPSLENLRNYGLQFKAYGVAYRTIDNLYQTVKEHAENPIITNEDINRLAEICGFSVDDHNEFVEEITDENGQITEESVKEYLKKVHRNIDDEHRDAYEEVCEEVMDVLDEIRWEGEIIKEDDQIIIDGALHLLKIEMKIKLDPELEDAIETIENIDNVEDLLSIINNLREKTLKTMEDDMTEEEKVLLDEKIAEKQADIEKAQEAFNEAISEARKLSEKALEAAKNARLEANLEIKIG